MISGHVQTFLRSVSQRPRQREPVCRDQVAPATISSVGAVLFDDEILLAHLCPALTVVNALRNFRSHEAR
jgi:hypothetical protein